jgi:ribonuclease P/MRP protein subunit POP7
VPNKTHIPPDATIAKRPLLHPAIPSPYAGANAPKVVYVGTRTPFVSALKRVRSLLGHVDKRGMQAALAASGRGRGRGRGRGGMGPGTGNRGARNQANGRGGATQNEAEREPVVVKATGKAVEKAMGLAVAMMAEKGWRVRVRTGSVAAIDDVVVGDVEEEEEIEKEQKQGEEGVAKINEGSTKAAEDEGGPEAMDVDVEADGEAEQKDGVQDQEEPEAESDEELLETRIRYTGMLEIEVTLRNDDNDGTS